MSRVHCSDCGSAVIVDPTGLCPDGHHVGAAGARVAQAMGSGGRPHADEPEPWVAQVVLDDDPMPTTATPRRARPVSVPGAEIADDDDADQESLLQELHALAEFGFADLGGASATAPTSPAPAPARSSAPVSPAPAPAAPPPGRADESNQLPTHRSGAHEPARGDELAALEAALHELSLPDDPAPAPTNGSGPTGDVAPGQSDGLAGLEGLAELDELFASAPGGPSAGQHGAPAELHAPQTEPDPTGIESGPTRTEPHPTAGPTPAAPPMAPPPTAAPPAVPLDPPPHPAPVPDAAAPADDAPAPAPANLDITNFTAKGGKVGGRKRRFGR